MNNRRKFMPETCNGIKPSMSGRYALFPFFSIKKGLKYMCKYSTYSFFLKDLQRNPSF